MFKFIVGFLIFPPILTMGECLKKIHLVKNQYGYVYNDNYPLYYDGNYYCEWIAESDIGTNIILNCDINLADNNEDHLTVFSSDNLSNDDSSSYYGYQSFSYSSNTNYIKIVFQPLSETEGGNFLCTISTSETINSCDCGNQNMERIVNGQNTEVNEFPMMAALVDERGNIVCGATIISPEYLLTAAHCQVNKNVEKLQVLVGDWDMSTDDDTSYTSEYNIDKFIVHPAYDNKYLTDDIAVIKVAEIITFNLGVSPVCLPFLYQTADIEDINVLALGWGTTSFGGPTSEILQQVGLTVIPQDTCSTKTRGIEKKFCTYHPERDTCQSDSGGPILWRDNANTKVQLLGIISSGFTCGTSYGINIDVRKYLDWIESITGDQFCVKP